MKIITSILQRFHRGHALAFLVGLAAFGLGTSAYGQANLTFSGGSGSPLSITLSQPVIFTITSTSGNSPGFVFQNVGNILGANAVGVAGNITFQINAGGSLSLNTAQTLAFGGIAATDLLLYGSLPGVTAGNIVTLRAGTVTTSGNVAAAAPAGGAFNVYLAEGSNGIRISTDGLAVPEPSTWALLGVGAMGVGVVVVRRRRALV